MWLIELIVHGFIDAIKSRRLDMVLMLVGFLACGVMAVGAALSNAEHRWGLAGILGALSAVFLGIFVRIKQKQSYVSPSSTTMT
jgi:hypothetical protein